MLLGLIKFVAVVWTILTLPIRLMDYVIKYAYTKAYYAKLQKIMAGLSEEEIAKMVEGMTIGGQDAKVPGTK